MLVFERHCKAKWVGCISPQRTNSRSEEGAWQEGSSVWKIAYGQIHAGDRFKRRLVVKRHRDSWVEVKVEWAPIRIGQFARTD